MNPARRFVLFAFLLLASCSAPPRQEPVSRSNTWTTAPMPDVSGLAWVAGDTFLVAHDAKAAYEPNSPRVSLAVLPDTTRPLHWQPLQVRWPEQTGLGSDLESIARIPGTRLFLLAESGDDATPYQRIYLAEYRGGQVEIREAAGWPERIFNVEGTAVARIGGELYFFYAERAHGGVVTRLRWAPLTLSPLAFGGFREIELRVPEPVGPNARPVSALEIAPDGRLYVGSASDPEVDTGPFRSRVWEVGRMEEDGDGGVRLSLRPEPLRVAALDGLKIEAVAIRPGVDGKPELYVGTDDEQYGAVIRSLPN